MNNQHKTGEMTVEYRATPEVVGADDPIDLIDLALTVAENIWLLLLVPVVVGLIAYGLASLVPRTYESVAVLQPAPPAPVPIGKDTMLLNPAALTHVFANAVATKMATPAYLEGARQKLKEKAASTGGSAAMDLHPLNASVKTQVGANDNLVTLRVSSTSATGSQLIASGILEHTYAESRPKSSELKRLTDERVLLEQQIAGLKLTEERVRALIERNGATPTVSDLANTYALISTNLVDMHRRFKEIDAQLEGITEEVVVQKPTLPSGPSSPRQLIIALLGAVSTGFLLLIVIFVRHSWRTSGRSSQHAQRLQALKRRYGLAR